MICAICEATPGTGADPLTNYRGRALCAVCRMNAESRHRTIPWGLLNNIMLFVISCMAALFAFFHTGTERFQLCAIATLCFTVALRDRSS